MSDLCYDKTEKGREEIQSRKYQLASRLRSLLVIIDGKQSRNQLLEKVAPLGLNESHLHELESFGFIELSAAKLTSAPPALTPDVAPIETPQAEYNEATANTAINPTGLSDSERFQIIYKFYTETIKANLGLRGFTLQMKVEKAGNLNDLRDLRITYLEAIIKAKGRETARALRDRLDSLFGENFYFEI